MDMENGRCPYHSEPAKLELRPWRKHTWRESGGNHCFPIGGSAYNAHEPTRPYFQVCCTSCGAAGYASPSREAAKLAWRSLCNAADIASDVAEEMGINVS